MNDHRDLETEALIRRALEARAKEIVVSPEARDSIRDRRGDSPWARPATYAAVAAAVVLIAGIALVNRSDDTTGEVDSAGSSTTLPDDTQTTTPTTAPTTTADTSPDTTTPLNVDYPAGFNQNGLAYPELASHPLDVALAGMALAVAPNGIDAASAAMAYAETLGIDDPQLSESTIAVADSPAAADHPDSRLAVYDVLLRGEDGSVGDRAAMTVVLTSLAGDPAAWHVTHVVTPEFTIDSVEDNTADTIRITGSGRAFEGTATLFVADAPGILLSVGGVEFGDFSVIVPRPAGDRVSVRVEGTTVFEGAVPNIAAYRTIPIPRQTSLSVFGVAADDVLNVRTGAGVGNDILATLAPDATGMAPTGNVEFVGTERWWEIETEDGRGWVNSRYLVTVTNTSLRSGLDDRMEDALAQLSDGLVLDYFDSTVEFGGIGVYADFPTPWTAVDRNEFDVDRNWSPEGTEDRTCDCDMTVAEFLGFDTAKWDLAEYEAPGPELDSGESNVFFEHGQFPEFFSRYTTASIYIPEPNPDVSLDWRRYTVVFDFEDGTPVIRGIWRWGWTP